MTKKELLDAISCFTDDIEIVFNPPNSGSGLKITNICYQYLDNENYILPITSDVNCEGDRPCLILSGH